ncbi:hypothetical protein [Polaribacter ponticola]|uniref:Uncharacterized protein n=1 Tax=Polaribacter ponticola TaxID=2978475 RepID=A0ABT5S7K5_9FLAO|nr:hypothetical protein [Polaribacter sp. MSW5]MDD7913789.1 hypothetical protein [Polaribacter sp. MSW5]
MKLTEILRDSNYKLTQFTTEQVENLEKTIFLKEVRGKEVPFINCLVRRKRYSIKTRRSSKTTLLNGFE